MTLASPDGNSTIVLHAGHVIFVILATFSSESRRSSPDDAIQTICLGSGCPGRSYDQSCFWSSIVWLIKTVTLLHEFTKNVCSYSLIGDFGRLPSDFMCTVCYFESSGLDISQLSLAAVPFHVTSTVMSTRFNLYIAAWHLLITFRPKID